MNKLAPYLLLLLLALISANLPEKRLAIRKYRQITTEFVDSMDPEKNYRRVEKFDKHGEPIEMREWTADGQLSQRTVYINTSQMNKKSVFSAQDSLISLEITEFDKRGRKIHYFALDKKKNKSEEVKSEYNKWGEKQYEIIRKNGRCTQIRKYHYNDLGLQISQITTDSVGKVLSQKKFSYSK